jgi:large subunit ribosomal protein L15
MKYNELQTSPTKNRRRAGRGISAGRGKTAGRGTKGQGARTGNKFKSTFQGGSRSLVTAIPKLRGFKSLRSPAQVVYSDELNKFADKAVDNKALLSAGLIDDQHQAVKVINREQITTKVDLRVAGASKSVQEMLKKAGGSFEKTAVPLPKSTKKTDK